MTGGLYIIPLIKRLLAKTIKDIHPKYLFLSDLVAVFVSSAGKKQFFTKSEWTTCGLILKYVN